MIYSIIFIFFLSIFMLFYSLMIIINSKKLSISNRLKQIENINSKNQENNEEASFKQRMLTPFYNSISEFLLKIAPKQKIALINKKLEGAGLLKNNSAQRWIYTKSMVSIIISILIAMLSLSVDPNIFKALLLFIIVMLTINTFFNFYLSKRIERRKKMILKDLPYTLDLITVSVEAGLSFDGAMARVINNIEGELCTEFAKGLKEIKMGIERKTALKNMSTRCDVKELSMFITALIQADDLGVSLGRVLRIESSNLREQRKQAAREKAMKAPIKMLFPLIFFIFPSIFIIILGPAVIRIINIFVTR